MQTLRSHKALSIFLSVIFLLFGAVPSLAKAPEKKKFVVVIDAGHGGNDVGAHEHGVMEKNVNLAVARKLGALIKKKLKDTEVIYTRDDDTFISLQKRADVANKAKADLFISIHCNSVDKSNKNRNNVVGATTYVLGRHRDGDNLAVARRENAVVELDADDSAHYSQFDPSSDESYIIFEMTQKKNLQNSVRFASDVQKEMASAGRYSRGVQQAGFWVLWSTAMPAALVELDFICNPEQAKFLNSDAGQEKLVGAIFNAVKNYESYFRKSLGAQVDDAVESDDAAPLMAQTETRSTRSQATEMAELPDSESRSDAAVRRHREQPSQRPSTASTSAHRRRPAGARAEGADNPEQAVIPEKREEQPRMVALADEAPRTATATQAAAPEKTAQRSEAPKSRAAATGTPARRDKAQNSKRKKAVRSSIRVVYKVLLFTSDEELLANDELFQGLTPVASFRENNTFKYTYGESADRNEMEDTLARISPLFPEACVIKCTTD